MKYAKNIALVNIYFYFLCLVPNLLRLIHPRCFTVDKLPVKCRLVRGTQCHPYSPQTQRCTFYSHSLCAENCNAKLQSPSPSKSPSKFNIVSIVSVQKINGATHKAVMLTICVNCIASPRRRVNSVNFDCFSPSRFSHFHCNARQKQSRRTRICTQISKSSTSLSKGKKLIANWCQGIKLRSYKKLNPNNDMKMKVMHVFITMAMS